MVEVCDNGIDDDGDGAIDLNDDDCACQFQSPISLIPNASFENMDCCPQEIGELRCAEAWIQASAPTIDYINQCGNYFGPQGLMPPLPYPDGQGCLGFRNGILHQPQFKEYAGACLVDTLFANQKYSFNFWVGFVSAEWSPPINLTIFGTTTCDDLPFGDPAPGYGCPMGSGNWIVLGEEVVSGENEWINVDMTIRPDRDITAIVVGPDCSEIPSESENYYYFDNLTLYLTADFEVTIEGIDGARQCDGNFTVGAFQDFEPNPGYQWYLDGVAIPGATDETYEVPFEAEGELLLVTDTRFGCIYSNTIDLTDKTVRSTTFVTQCEGDPYILGDQMIYESGIFTDTIATSGGCDSIATVQLNFISSIRDTVRADICQGKSYSFYDQSFEESGSYLVESPNASTDCNDQHVLLLEVHSPPVVMDFPSEIEQRFGEPFTLQPDIDHSKLASIYWQNSRGDTVSTRPQLRFSGYEEGTYTLHLINDQGCQQTYSTRVNLSYQYELFIPNVISPNGDGVNDRLNAFGPNTVDHIQSLHIYDRWGNLMYESKDVTYNQKASGWDASSPDIQKGSVYLYHFEILFNDGVSQSFQGTVLIL